MKSRVDPDWKLVLKRAWSMRFMLLASVFLGIEAVLPLFVDRFPRGIFAVLTFLSIVGAAVSRVILQNGFDNSKKS